MPGEGGPSGVGLGPGSGVLGVPIDGTGTDLEGTGGEAGNAGVPDEDGVLSLAALSLVTVPSTSPPPLIEPVDIVVASSVSASIGSCGEYAHFATTWSAHRRV